MKFSSSLRSEALASIVAIPRPLPRAAHAAKRPGYEASPIKMSMYYGSIAYINVVSGVGRHDSSIYCCTDLGDLPGHGWMVERRASEHVIP